MLPRPCISVAPKGQIVGFHGPALHGIVSTVHSVGGLRHPQKYAGIAGALAAECSVKPGILVGAIEHQPSTAGRTVAQQFAVVHAPIRLAKLVPSIESGALEFLIGDKSRTPELLTAGNPGLREGGESQGPKCCHQAHCEFVGRTDHHFIYLILPARHRLLAAGPGNPASHPAVP